MNVKRFLPHSLRKRLDRGRLCIDEFAENVGKELPAETLLLDAGAGECWYKPHFSHLKYYSVDFGLGKGDWDYTNLDVLANLLQLPFEDNTFDAVLCTQVLEHINLPGDFVKELYRILKPGGKLYLSAPQGFKEHQTPHDYFRYTSFGLRFLFEEAGFKVEYVKPFGGFFFFLGDRISPVHRYLFSNKRSIGWKLLFLPLEPISKILFSIVLPLIVSSLDSFDKKQKWTNGYGCKVIK
ncbi:MAG: class I SAM-dependent methyltransferase [Deltaproteobacteria bacterium]|nr:class I SAM-dependent methyltransferase [Deltaproteobacteria bacterium]